MPQGGTCTSDADCCSGALGSLSCNGGTCCFPSGARCYDRTQCCGAGADCVRTVCTTTGCVGDGDDGAPCDDGIGCTAFDYCNAGRCLPGLSTCGNDNDADADCIRADCDPDAGCILAIEPDGSPCEDGIACTGSDYCVTGQCYGGIYYDFLCPNQDYCDDDCIQYYCDPGQGCVAGVEFESAPCSWFFCALEGQFSACNAAGACECRLQQPPDFGCP
jgi:hypothetical protein